MKRRFLSILLGLGLLAGAAACSDDKQDPSPIVEDPVEKPEPIGMYRFDGQPYDLYYGSYAEDEYSYYFVFSPLDGTRPLTTYALIGLKKGFEGQEMDATRIFHNDDYYFVFEDPVRLYSQYRQLKSGTIYVKRNAQDDFTVRLDVLLYDGTPFAIDFSGRLAAAASTE